MQEVVPVRFVRRRHIWPARLHELVYELEVLLDGDDFEEGGDEERAHLVKKFLIRGYNGQTPVASALVFNFEVD